ncbi:Thioesterase/thiol ester dehydrase-isomerase [Piedraia hortae CBS 480.64]|uniref:Thioesterase/thiol ester dehydrase-isomerase n=1 Tax=Piedraia hortae CBS 480.64 TaxID=1314780 RepID=A0A6A7C6A3_9PEZI|nr:Thioesterase/thiol ester dehydrase-isomerase [Piedraia hortae CBS 480.64]
MADPDKTPEMAHIESFMQDKVLANPIYAFLLKPVKITGASKGHVVARLPLSENHMNSMGSIHGSVTATIVDWMGGVAIASYDLRTKTGVSLDIHVTYQSGAKMGDEIEIEGIAEKVGRSIAFTRINIYKVQDGKRGNIVVSGTHTKFIKTSD